MKDRNPTMAREERKELLKSWMQAKKTYHFIIDFMKMDFTDFFDHIFILKSYKAKAYKKIREKGTLDWGGGLLSFGVLATYFLGTADTSTYSQINIGFVCARVKYLKKNSYD